MAVGSSPSPLRIAVVGGGAAGFFAALAAADGGVGAQVTVYEATGEPLAKVRISGGGRCNVTHACFEPRELVKRYPRGGRELLGPLHRFGPRDTVAWFAARGVELKTESDGRMFPVTDDSGTIVACLRRQADEAGIRLRLRCAVREVHVSADDSPGPARFTVEAADGSVETFDRVVLATGGPRGTAGGALAGRLGHTIEPPVPSLFTFHVPDPRLAGLAGLSVPQAALTVPGTRLREEGALLVTHWGFSGPAALKLSAWGARDLAKRDYCFPLQVAWRAGLTVERARADLLALRDAQARRLVVNANPWELPARLWERLVAAAGIGSDVVWTALSNARLLDLAQQAAGGVFDVNGKSLNKEEFVTCGGVRLREVDFRTMESRIRPGLFFAGEALDIDGITGGFNFQAAWTTGWIAGQAAADAAGR